MHVGVCRLTLIASHSHSLKDRRSVVRKLRDRVRAQFHVMLSEVGGQDTWQRIELGFAVVSTSRGKAESVVADIIAFVDRAGLAELVGEERDVISYGDGPFGDHPALASSADDSWIPDSWKTDADPDGTTDADPEGT